MDMQAKESKKDDPKKCKQMWVKEQDIYDIYMQIIKELGANKEFIEILKTNIECSLDKEAPNKLDSFEEEIDKISARLIEIMRSGIPAERRQKEISELMAKKDEITRSKQKLQEQLASSSLTENRINTIKSAIDEMKICTEFNEQIFKDTVEKIKIKDGEAKFIFKCGIEITKKINQGA